MREAGEQVSGFDFHLKTEASFGISTAVCDLGSHLITAAAVSVLEERRGRNSGRVSLRQRGETKHDPVAGEMKSSC